MRWVDGRYELTSVIGEGGMSTVWRARRAADGALVALKVVEAEMAAEPEARARFAREATVASRIESPFVAPVLDHGIASDGRAYLAMPLYEGCTLRALLDRMGRLDVPRVRGLVAQIGAGLSAAHHAGLVHRDLKPSNIFLVADPTGETVRLLDFGVAKASDALAGSDGGLTQSGSLLGTPRYMSPEQTQGARDVDHRSDLWALGVVVYECVTGTPPFTAVALGPLIAQIMMGGIVPPSELAPGVATPRLDAWIRRALARDRAERFDRVENMVAAFAEATAAA